MKRELFLILMLLLPFAVSSQNHEEEIPAKLQSQSHIILDFVNNLSGGIENGSKMLVLADFSVDYNPRQGIFKNTSFHGHLLKTAGDSPSENIIGDIQIASNIEGRSSRFIYELYFKQKLGDFIVSAGLHDLNTEFMFSDHAGNFVNSSFGIAPAISVNMPVSIFPVTTLGGYITYSTKKLEVSAGLYNSNHNFAEEESFRFENHLYQQGYLGVGELRYRFYSGNQVTGEYKMGVFVKECEPQPGGDQSTARIDKKNHGFYFIGDQLLTRTPAGKTLNAFVQWGLTPAKKNFVPAYWGAGISLQGFSSEYLPQQIGLAVGSVKLNELKEGFYTDAKKLETVLELTSSFSLLNRLSFQPDFQYIINPSGRYENAFVLLLRLKADLL
ncbi:MAG: carbohydrate porin [Bacteroidota bacterium]|nr:carbohydrate porin [Bacteroidota bacterium]